MTTNPRLIIADDNLQLAGLLARTATSAGWAVTQCKDGAELMVALETVAESALVVLDIKMPNLDGIEVLRELMHQPEARRFRFCLMTGGAHVNAVAGRMIAKAGDLSISNSLFKPFSLDEFRAVLDEQKSLLMAQ